MVLMITLQIFSINRSPKFPFLLTVRLNDKKLSNQFNNIWYIDLVYQNEKFANSYDYFL